MKKIVMSTVALATIMGSFNVVSAAEDGVSILNDVKFKAQIRPRFEYADVDNGVDAGTAFTARTHLSLTGGLLGVDGLTSTIGIQTVNNFGYTAYNPADAAYDTIMDPQQAMLSEATLDYSVGKTAIHAGRSQVNLDNQRFIGTVGWRQTERSYDTVYVANNDVKDLSILAAFVYGYAGVTGVTTTDTSSILLHVNYKVMDELSITAYDYMLASIHDTMGIALTGKVDVGAKLTYRAEFAMQTDATMEYQSVPGTADASYMNVDVGANFSGILAGVNYELLSGADAGGKTAFTTPLATGHKFNGWADKFLSTPTGGLQDMNVRAGYKTKDFGKLLAVYHVFTADTAMATPTGASADDLGSEIDVVYVRAIPGMKNLKGLVKFAAYSAGDVAGYTLDVNKAWVQLDYKF